MVCNYSIFKCIYYLVNGLLLLPSVICSIFSPLYLRKCILHLHKIVEGLYFQRSLSMCLSSSACEQNSSRTKEPIHRRWGVCILWMLLVWRWLFWFILLKSLSNVVVSDLALHEHYTEKHVNKSYIYIYIIKLSWNSFLDVSLEGLSFCPFKSWTWRCLRSLNAVVEHKYIQIDTDLVYFEYMFFLATGSSVVFYEKESIKTLVL